MFKNIVEKIIGSYSARAVKEIRPIVEKINSYEEEYKKLTDEELKAKTPWFKERLEKGETLDDILPEAFAAVREASDRVLGMRHFDVQLIGGVVMHQGRIAEMKTGEGKTLVATLPSYLNGLSGKGVHVVTVNDYLAKRDSEWMGKIHTFLGLSVGLVINGMDPFQKRAAYACDITYGTNNEFGFDYLRDNTVIYKEQMVQRGHHFAIVDEVDSILIDEARTPLIISGFAEKSSELYERVDAFVRTLKKEVVREVNTKESMDDLDADYIVDEKAKSATLTPKGAKKAEGYFGIENLTDPDNIQLHHHINLGIKAHGVMRRDYEYVVKDGQVLIVDEFTGRIMEGRRYSEGLHQAIEAKEHVKIEGENKTIATITFQNYFRLYQKLSGMTGTAVTEETEFQQIYKLDVVAIPTNKPMIREDLPDFIFRTEQGKFDAIVNEIKDAHEKGQPVLVGTVSVEKSEEISKALKKNKVAHEVLNAKFHEREAQIIAQAGKPGAVTIATNMAGRGTDIMLGGNVEFMAKRELKRLGYEEDAIAEADGQGYTEDETILEVREKFNELKAQYKKETEEERKAVIAAGGLYIIGTERHESRRIDNQLRGRAGRQGDPGKSRFYLSFEDDLMRRFASPAAIARIDKVGFSDEMAVDNSFLSKMIENAQKNVESNNFQARKTVLGYDDVVNEQRKMIYQQRQKVLDCMDVRDNIDSMMRDVIEQFVEVHTNQSSIPDDWDLDVIIRHFEGIFLDEGELSYDVNALERLTKKGLVEELYERAEKKYQAREEEVGSDKMREIERIILLQVVDKNWIEHLDNLEQLKQGIFLRAYAQKDPLVEFRIESADMFDEMTYNIKNETVTLLFTLNLQRNTERKQVVKESTITRSSSNTEKSKPVVKKDKVGRNDPCPCGSGKKYKKCCGANITYNDEQPQG